MRGWIRVLWSIVWLLPGVWAAEKTDADYPLGKIGGRYFAQTDSHMIRVSEVLEGGPGDLAGLQVNDYIYGAFGEITISSSLVNKPNYTMLTKGPVFMHKDFYFF
ncbi:hypothetical protein [Rubritalea tangerina]|uniref:Uncharacterized protein n=1 Tax=Rubritalea tangerina TaxID=430798 RepID=A0ABW4ZF20_9BACT